MEIKTTPITGLILHFRTPEKTLACLQSLQQEGIKNAIIIDNSEDGGKSIINMQQSLNDLQNIGLTTQVLSTGYNLGFSAGVSYGLKHIASQDPSHVLLINSDAKLQAGSLEKMRFSLKDAAIVAPLIAQNNQIPTSPFAYYDRFLGLITRTPKVTPLRHASGCCLLIHKDQTKLPLFDQSFFFYGEDVMLGFSAQKNNIKIQVCSKAYVSHATSTSSKNGSIFYEYHINRSHWLLARKLARNRLEYFMFITARCLTLPTRALVRSLRNRSLVAWHGLFAATFDIVCGRCRNFTPPAP